MTCTKCHSYSGRHCRQWRIRSWPPAFSTLEFPCHAAPITVHCSCIRVINLRGVWSSRSMMSLLVDQFWPQDCNRSAPVPTLITLTTITFASSNCTLTHIVSNIKLVSARNSKQWAHHSVVLMKRIPLVPQIC